VEKSELEDLMSILEAAEDTHGEILVAALLKELNDASKALGLLIINYDETLAHETWKRECDQARAKVDDVIARIRALS